MSIPRDTREKSRTGEPDEQEVVLAFDVGGTRIKAGLVRGSELLARSIETLEPRDKPPDLVRVLLDIGKRLRGDVAVQAIGVSMKGLIDPWQGVLLDVNETWAHMIGRPIAQMLSEASGLPVCVENDARMYTTGELLYGAGRDIDNLLCLTLGTGIGSGVALQRRVLRGPRGFAGILGGHITIQVDGPRCTCGNLGCLEAFIGTAPLVRKAAELERARYGNQSTPVLSTPLAIFAAEREGDPVAREVVAYYTRYLSAGIVTLIHAYDPDLVLLGGGIAQASAQFMPALQRYIDTHTWTLPRGRVRVTRAELGDNAALLGVAALARGLDILQ